MTASTANNNLLPNGCVSIDLVRASYRAESFPEDWTEADRAHSAARYAKWLRLKQLHPTRRLAPTRDIDMFWHLHMLAPVAYHRDCVALFGRVLDHDGGFGRQPDELEELKRVFAETSELWEQTYGEPYRADGVWLRDAGHTNCWHDCENRCWHACSEANMVQT